MATRLYTPTEYAAMLRMSPQYVRRCCREGTIKAFRFNLDGGKRHVWRIPFDEGSMDRMAAINESTWKETACNAGI